MKIEIQDKDLVIIDGEEYVRKEKTLQGEVKFEEGQWVILKPYNKHFPQRITKIDYPYFWVDNEYDGYLLKDSNAFYNLRPATPAEIETHLRKICEEKYVGKRVSVIKNRITNKRHPAPYVSQYDQYWMVDTKGRGVLVYENGKFAEIIPDKKPLPKTREEFKRYNTAWSEFWLKTPTGSKHDDNVVSFLDQYDFNE